MTEGLPIPDDDDLLVAEYVLGVLPHGERVALARRLQSEAALAARAQVWERQLAPLGALIEPVQPPASVLAAVERRLFPAEPATAGLWRSLGFWRGLTAALFCALLVSATLLATRGWPPASSPSASYVAELSGPQDAVRLVALVEPGTGKVKINRVAGAPSAGRDLQLWLIAGDAAPVSIGVLPREAMSTLQLPAGLAGELGPRTVLAISDEPQGGSPTGLPTGAVLATGALSAI